MVWDRIARQRRGEWMRLLRNRKNRRGEEPEQWEQVSLEGNMYPLLASRVNSMTNHTSDLSHSLLRGERLVDYCHYLS